MSFRSYIKVGRRAAYEGRYTSRVNPTEVSVGGEGVDIDLSGYVTTEEFAADQARQDGGDSGFTPGQTVAADSVDDAVKGGFYLSGGNLYIKTL